MQIEKYLLLSLLSFHLVDASMLTRTQVLMGTFVDITLPQKHFAMMTKSFKIIKNIEKELSSYDTTSSLFQLNQKKVATLTPFLKEALEKSLNYYKQTDGYFDITIGSITKKLYHFGEEVKSPSTQALKRATLNIHAIDMNDTTIKIGEDITLDLGGMGKGFAVDKVANYLKEQNITQGKIALSGDIRCLGKCAISIQSPFKEEVFAKITTKVPQASISTSGTYRRFATSKKEHHLLNPKKHQPQDNFLSISLFSIKNNTQLDAFATAISVMPKDKALEFLNTHKELSYLIIFSDGTRLYHIDTNYFHLETLKKHID